MAKLRACFKRAEDDSFREGAIARQLVNARRAMPSKIRSLCVCNPCFPGMSCQEARVPWVAMTACARFPADLSQCSRLRA